jgi:hypothetical protein
VILMMTVKQCRARIGGDEIDLDGAESRHIDGIFHHARGRLFAYLGDLEGVTIGERVSGQDLPLIVQRL